MLTFAEKSRATQQTTSAKPTISSRAHFEQSRDPNPVLHLQRTIGNQAVHRLLQGNAEAPSHFGHEFSRISISPPRSGAIQTRLAINTEGDEYEQEAERVADQVMRMPQPRVQRACACETCSKSTIERNGDRQLQTMAIQGQSTSAANLPSIVQKVISSTGQPLDHTTKAFMESRFGYDFGHVRIHASPQAGEAATAVNARAFTVGSMVVFDHGEYSPTSVEGRRLLAHELAHVVQQSPKKPSSDRFQAALSLRHTAPLIQRFIQIPAALLAALAAAGRALLACIIGAAFGVGIDYVFQRAEAWWRNQPFRWNRCLAIISGVIGCVSAGVGSAISRAIFRSTGGQLEEDFATRAAVWIICWLYGRFPVVPIAIILKWMVSHGCMDASELPPGVQPD